MSEYSDMTLTMLAILRDMDPSMVVLTVMFIVVLCVVWSWHSDKESDFHLQQVLVDNVTNKISIEKVGYMVVLALMAWGFVSYMIKGELPEWYVYAFVGIFVVGRIASSGFSVWKDVSKPKADEERQ